MLLVNVSYPNSSTPGFYTESLYTPLSVLLALPFVFEILPILERMKLAIPAIIILILIGCIRIYAAHYQYTSRIDYEQSFLDKYGTEKVIVKAKKQDKYILQMLWATPYEFLLLSVSEHRNPASIIIDDHPETMQWLNSAKNVLRVNWETYSYSELPSRYFRFTDSTSGYREVDE